MLIDAVDHCGGALLSVDVLYNSVGLIFVSSPLCVGSEMEEMAYVLTGLKLTAD